MGKSTEKEVTKNPEGLCKIYFNCKRTNQ